MDKVSENFLGIPETGLDESGFVILPVPLEKTTSCQKGTLNGPRSIIHSSAYVELYDEYLDTEAFRYGIKTVQPPQIQTATPGEAVSIIKEEALKYIGPDRFVIGLGGEHSVSTGLFRACAERDVNLRLLSLDAHADLRDSYEGTEYSHACTARRIIEEGAPAVIAGVRSISREEKDFIGRQTGIDIHWAYAMKDGWERDIALSIPAGNYYLSFDVDFLDPSIMPETGTPEPGGFMWNETVSFLETLVSRPDIEVSGADFTELSPSSEFSPSSFLVARLAYRLIGIIALKRLRRRREGE